MTTELTVPTDATDDQHDDEPGGRPDWDRPAAELDDVADRQELQHRYYGLLQELRVLLPGVQILVAFLFTVPFASGFDRLDDLGRDLYAVSLVAGLLAVVAFATPTALHRVGARRSRAVRLAWGIRTTRVGLVLFAVSLVSALTVVCRVVLGPAGTVVAVGSVALAIVAMWVVLPLVGTRRTSASSGSRDLVDG